jgi:hypothetical protein
LWGPFLNRAGFAARRKANESPEVVQSAGGAPSFAGYDCTEVCSGHQAGYDWAEEKGIEDEDICDNLSTNSDPSRKVARHMSTEMTGAMIDLKMIYTIRPEQIPERGPIPL